MFHESSWSGGETTLNFAEGPSSGAPLLFLHGVTRCWQDFVPLLPALATRWQVYALDFRGHGRSGRAAGNYRVVDYVRDAVTFLRDRLSQPTVLYGHSLGAMVAVAAAAQAPDLVRAVVLEDPPFDTLGRDIAQTPFHSFFVGIRSLLQSDKGVDGLARELAELRVATPGTDATVRLGDLRDGTSLRFSARCLTRLDPAVLDPLTEGRWLEGYERDSLLAQVRCPALLLQGDCAAGGMLTDADAERVAALIARCTRVALPRVGHLIHWLQTETTLRLATGFLESL